MGNNEGSKLWTSPNPKPIGKPLKLLRVLAELHLTALNCAPDPVSVQPRPQLRVGCPINHYLAENGDLL